MQAIALSTNRLPALLSRSWLKALSPKWLKRLLAVLCSAVWLSSCTARSTTPTVRTITLQQQWTLNPGDEIGGSEVAGSLGDISLALKHAKVSAPFDGKLEPSEIDSCAFYSTPEIPAYLFRLCGLKGFAYGDIKAGKPVGKGDYLSFATLRRQPDGTWIIVEPARGVLEKALEAG
ncbi:MAG: hypothetical protein WA885_06325 [Phormidesmis sp.]